MARPIKSGLDYFPFDTDFFNDRKIRKLIKSGSLEWVSIYVFLLTEIYKDQGYYITVSEDDVFDLADQIRVDESILKKVIESCVEIGLFDRSIYEHHQVLTASSIQRRFIKICKQSKRKNWEINHQFSLVNSEETRINSEETRINSEESTQSKVKESIEKERKGKESIQILTYDNFLIFENKVKTTLKKHMKYTANDGHDVLLQLFFRLIKTCLCYESAEKIKLPYVHNYFCHLIESLSVIDKSNFTIPYMVRQYDRINSNFLLKTNQLNFYQKKSIQRK